MITRALLVEGPLDGTIIDYEPANVGSCFEVPLVEPRDKWRYVRRGTIDTETETLALFQWERIPDMTKTEKLMAELGAARVVVERARKQREEWGMADVDRAIMLYDKVVAANAAEDPS